MTRIGSALVAGLVLIVAFAGTASAAVPHLPRLVDIRAAHHPGFDRLVFEFQGGLPTAATVGWVDRVIGDATGQPVTVQGNAFLRIVFRGVDGHTSTGDSSYGPAKRAFALPNVAHVANAGDFEGVVTFGVGLMKKTSILRTSRLRAPARVVVDVATTYAKASVGVGFLEEGVDPNAAAAAEIVSLTFRSVPAGGRANGALLRLWAGPTEEELAAGLRFESSHTKGFRDLRVSRNGIARLVLKGRCDGEGEAVTVADLIIPTLKAQPEIEWVKIYDAAGHTQQPWGLTDSIPDCLAPAPA